MNWSTQPRGTLPTGITFGTGPRIFGLRRESADLPYLPVAYLKGDVPFSLVEPSEVKRTLTSSSTTGQMPSRIVLDSPTARRMTKGVVSIAQDFIGSARRPYLVVDVPGAVTGGAALGARGAAIQGLQPFASEVTYCLKPGSEDLALDREKLLQFAEARRKSRVLVYGFTYILWKHFVKPLRDQNLCLDIPNVHILHSGGWKLLQEEAVEKKTFNEGVASVFGCATDRVIDFYGMVENVGVIYPDCPELNKHVPVFADIIARDPLTLRPVREGETGHRTGLQRAAHELSWTPPSDGRSCSGCRLRRVPVRQARGVFPVYGTSAEGRGAWLRKHRAQPPTDALVPCYATGETRRAYAVMLSEASPQFLRDARTKADPSLRSG